MMHTIKKGSVKPRFYLVDLHWKCLFSLNKQLLRHSQYFTVDTQIVSIYSIFQEKFLKLKNADGGFQSAGVRHAYDGCVRASSEGATTAIN